MDSIPLVFITGEAGLRSERCHRVARPPVDRLGSALFKPGRTWILGQRGWLGSALWGQRGWLGGALLGQRGLLGGALLGQGLREASPVSSTSAG